MLQACESSSSIRHAVIALGALDIHKWKTPARTLEQKLRRQFAYHEVSYHLVNSHLSFRACNVVIWSEALKQSLTCGCEQYSMAIREMRDTISEGKLDLNTSLIAIILFVCFETYHGNSASAVAQIRVASKLIEQKCHDWNTDSSFSRPPPDIDNELLERFTELEIQAVAHSGYTMSESQRERLNCRQNIFATMPDEFSSVRQARMTLHLIVLRQIHGIFVADGFDPVWTEGMIPAIENPDHPDNRYLSPTEKLQDYENWVAAFDPLLTRARNSGDGRLLRSATALRIYHLTCYLGVIATIVSFRENYYNQTHLLAEIVALAKSLRRNEKPENEWGFSTEMQLVFPLSMVAWKYRHRACRREAIRLLLAFPRREGLWDGLFIGKTAQWVANIEEEGLTDEEYVPLEMATNFEVTGFDGIARSATLQAFVNDMKSPGKVEVKKTRICW